MTTISNKRPDPKELPQGESSVASLVASTYLQQIQDQALVHLVLHFVQTEPLAAIHQPL